jgi:hypothetical protein
MQQNIDKVKMPNFVSIAYYFISKSNYPAELHSDQALFDLSCSSLMIE